MKRIFFSAVLFLALFATAAYAAFAKSPLLTLYAGAESYSDAYVEVPISSSSPQAQSGVYNASADGSLFIVAVSPGGSGQTVVEQLNSGGGGGAGGYSEKSVTVSRGDKFYYTVGSDGSISITSAPHSLTIATTRGAHATSSTGAAGGTASGGDTDANGLNGGSGNMTQGGAGGDSYIATGGIGGTSGSRNGQPGSQGSGGGGAYRSGGGGTGGAGGDGFIYFDLQ